ncbi:MAG: hypothetical protein ACM32E_24080 [Gemmatimonadota bacterium]
MAEPGRPAARWRPHRTRWRQRRTGTLPPARPQRAARSQRLARSLRLAAAALAVAVGVSVLVAGAALAGLTAEGSGTVPALVHAAGSDGLWLGHAWVDGRRGDRDLAALAARLRATRIRDVFVHVGPLSDNGSLDPARHPRARWLVAGLHRLLPGLRVQAWLGDLVSPGHLRLDDPASRARVLRAAAGLLAEGFGGIHYDLEPVPGGDPGFLALLAASHTLTRAHRAVLSVACPQVEPLPLPGPAQWLLGRLHWWPAGYLHAVAARSDEVALMTYGTGVPTATAYSGYIRLETSRALAAVPPRDLLLIGLPAYHTSEFGHTGGETVAAAARGVRLALGSRVLRRPVGVSLYVDFTATAGDWAAYRAGWVRAHPAGSIPGRPGGPAAQPAFQKAH